MTYQRCRAHTLNGGQLQQLRSREVLQCWQRQGTIVPACVCKCMRVCTHVCVCACLCACVRVCVHVCMHVSILIEACKKRIESHDRIWHDQFTICPFPSIFSTRLVVERVWQINMQAFWVGLLYVQHHVKSPQLDRACRCLHLINMEE